MARVENPYTKLAGRGLRRTPFGISATRSRLWLGPDHLLSVDYTVASEEYRRFYFRDIEAFVIRRTPNRVVWNWIFSFLGLLMAGPFFFLWRTEGNGGYLIAAVGCAIFWGVMILINSLRGASCQTHIRTAVHLEQLPSLNRIPVTRKILARLQPLIIGAQGEATPEELENAPWMRGENLEGAAESKPPRVDNGAIHGTLFGLLIIEATVTGIYYAVSHLALSVAGLLIMLAGFLVSIVALLREGNSDLPDGVRAVTKCAIGYYVLKCVAGFVFTMIYAIRHPREQVLTGLEMIGEPGFPEASMISVVIAAIIGLIGVFVLLGHLRRRRVASVSQ